MNTRMTIRGLGMLSAGRKLTDAPLLGARFLPDHSTATFTLLAPRATRVELWVYASPMDANPVLREVMAAQADHSLAATAAIGNAIFYGYRAWGPNWPHDPAWVPGSMTGFIADVDAAGNRFNPNKLLLDPYALEVTHDPLTPGHPDPTVYLSGLSSRTIDTGPFAPKGIVIDIPTADFGAKPE